MGFEKLFFRFVKLCKVLK